MLHRVRKSFASAGVCSHGGKAREYEQRAGAMPLDFSANINPLGSPPLEGVIHEELKRIGHYPDNNYAQLKAAAARFVGVPLENIVPGNGSSELIRLFAETALEDGDLALVPQPTFGEYENQCLLMGARVRKVPIKDGRPDLRDSDLKEAKALFICNPNNPTGDLLSKEEVLSLARRCEREEVFLLLDEAFIELSSPEESLAASALDMEYLFVMRSLTKSFGVPGLRLGFGVTNAPLARVMNLARIPWSISSLAAAAGAYLLGQEEHLERSRKLICEELIWLAQGLKDLGLEPMKSHVNFILVDISSSGQGSDQLAEKLASRGVLVRDCQSFGLGKGYIRVAVRGREENQLLIEALGRALKCRD
jgi:L-threonine-O-3-phosphate decarboxylase